MVQKFQIQIQDIINFWFCSQNKEKWFYKDPIFDKEITSKFLPIYEMAVDGELDHWKESALGTLALIIILDQFPRNMFRNMAKSFVTDDKALLLTKFAIYQKMDDGLSDDYKQFLYMPLMHSENLEDQILCFNLFAYDSQIQSYAKMHMDIIEKFGRFPHRNKIVDRNSTDEELRFLKMQNSSF